MSEVSTSTGSSASGAPAGTLAHLREAKEASYEHLCKYVTTDAKFLKMLFSARIYNAGEIDALVQYLVRIAISLGTTSAFFKELLKLEFEQTATSKSRTILRGNTLTTKAMDQFMQLTTDKFTNDTIGDVIRAMLANDETDLEVDISKLPPGDEETTGKLVMEHLLALESATEVFVHKMFSEETISKMPLELRCVAKYTADLAQAYNWEVCPLIGSFVMLRIFNPTVVFPEARKALGITNVTQKQRRNLILISKVLQNLSNGVLFGNKESYMVPLNNFVEKYQEKCNDFLQSCSVSEEVLKNFVAQQEKALELALQEGIITKQQLEDAIGLHELIVKHQSKIEAYFAQYNAEETEEFMLLLQKLPKAGLKPAIPQVPKPGVPVVEPPKKLSQTEEKYLQLLQKAEKIDMKYFDDQAMLTIQGKTKDGRPCAIFVEDRIRPGELDQILLYIIRKMDKLVEQEYVLIWCINNTSNQATRPGFQWLLGVYRTITRKWKKNLKGFYMIHPSLFYKIIINCFRPFVSEKFWKKFHLCDSVKQLEKDFDKEQIPLPPNVLTHDFLVNKTNLSQKGHPAVFGSSLTDVMTRPDHSGKIIPEVLEKTLTYIEKYGLQHQGIFRIPGNVAEIQKLKILYDNGDNIDLHHCDIHVITGVVKLFFREMPQPIFPFECYDKLIAIAKAYKEESSNSEVVASSITNHSTVEPIRKIIKQLPKLNLITAKRLFQFLHTVSQKSDVNMMTAQNLAICIGPNILRNKGENLILALKDTAFITTITEIMISEYPHIFERLTAEGEETRRPRAVRPTTVAFNYNYFRGATSGYPEEQQSVAETASTSETATTTVATSDDITDITEDH